MAFLPREVPHAYAVTSPTVRLLAMTTSGALPELFGAAGWDLHDPLPAGRRLTAEAVAAASRGVGHEVLGPPPALDAERLADVT